MNSEDADRKFLAHQLVLQPRRPRLQSPGLAMQDLEKMDQECRQMAE